MNMYLMVHYMLRKILHHFKRIYYSLGGGNNHIQGLPIIYRLKSLVINGENNSIVTNSKLPIKVRIVVSGNDHKLIINEGVSITEGTIWFEDRSNEIRIGSLTTIGEAHLAVAEYGTKLIIGSDCMISKNVRVATTDSHSVVDINTGDRINPAKDICIGNHVWLGYSSNVNKGVNIGDGSIIA